MVERPEECQELPARELLAIDDDARLKPAAHLWRELGEFRRGGERVKLCPQSMNLLVAQLDFNFGVAD